MAEVLAPISSTMLHTQDAFQPPSSQPNISAHRSSQVPRGVVYPQAGYRTGPPAPISPYAFQSTPPLRQDRQQVATYKSVPSRPGVPFRPPYQDSSASSVSSTSSSSNRSVPGNHGSIDDSVLALKNRQTLRDNRISSNMAASLSTPDLSLPSREVHEVKAPNRYHRLSQRFDNPPAKQPASEAMRPVQPVQPVAAPPAPLDRPTVDRNSIVVSRPAVGGRTGSFDDMSPAPNSARYKRRSFINRVDSSQAIVPAAPVLAPTWSQVVTGKYSHQGPLPPPQNPFARPQHVRSSSLGETQPRPAPKPAPARHSAYSPSPRPTSFYIESPKRPSFDPRPMTAPSNPVRPKSSTGPQGLAIQTEKPRPATAISSAEAAASPRIESIQQSRSVSASAAAAQLAALNKRGSSRNLKNRLRRAFSFSGSHELRKASAENNLAAELAKMKKETEQVDEDPSVAAAQEANGLGTNIYSGQAEFTASTDNISISSTASSASIMLRKFGRGMKKSTRNLRNMFRPKSMVVTGSESVEETVAADVSPVTVEAERLKVNVNVDPHDKPGGGTGYPKLERNSIEVPDGMAPEFDSPRKSIVGGDRERAEVLAAVRKGILKRSGPPSAASSPSIAQGELPIQGPTFFGDSNSSLPSPVGRPSSDSGAVTDEYFGGASNPAGSTRSLPTAAMRSVSFGTRVQFFDVWSSAEYDRRGDVVTCNCLTPLLAQQIKEELNTFKMEMEVHEDSKPHTHFF